ncbi:MAG: zinc-dependent metalloprotease [Janthinobacterium lividum]
MRLNLMFVLPLLAFCVPVTNAYAQTEAAPPATRSLASRVQGMQHMDGFLPLDWDAKAGKVYLEVSHLNEDVLLTHSLPHGTGSNDLGLDRGQIEPLSGGSAPARVVRFIRSGPKVLLLAPNLNFRSSAADPAEQASVHESFAESVLWGFKVEAEDPSGAVLLDATDFVLHDVHGVADILTETQQGSFHVDTSRSAVVPESLRAFPKNTSIEVLLTFLTENPEKARFVRDVTPDPHALTVHERVDFVQLPPLDGSFQPRRFDPRSGYFNSGYRDYSAPLGDALDQKFIVRHRLIKRDPSCHNSCEAVTPIQYYVDRGAPEPIRSALVEGARWWDQAYQAAGWAPNTFRVDVLPAGADPMDVRYNIIQWVHRYTRGWSYGEAVADPRTGEILKGNVTLGSLRGRQDYLIAEALLSPYKSGNTPTADPMLTMVLARIRQLSAHETGHTLGLAHNYIASSISQSDSVMDYPHPYISLDKAGQIDLSHAYAVNIGDWDKVAINYGYRQFAPGTTSTAEHAALSKILSDADKRGQIFITDEDARPFGSAHPHAHLWDNGADPAAELNRVLAVRAVALNQFGENAIRNGTPLSELEKTLVPLYLYHRYQAEATIKEIGGLEYRYNLRGDGQPLPEIVAAADQRKALTAVLTTLSPTTLTLPENLLRLLPPVAFGYPRTQESLPAQTGLTFDPIASAEAAADLTLRVLFNKERAARLVQYHARDPQVPALDDVIDATLKFVAARPTGEGLAAAVSRVVEARTIEALLVLAADPSAAYEARAIARARLAAWSAATPAGSGEAETAHHAALVARIAELQNTEMKFVPAPAITAPPGMPIGDDGDF